MKIKLQNKTFCPICWWCCFLSCSDVACSNSLYLLSNRQPAGWTHDQQPRLCIRIWCVYSFPCLNQVLLVDNGIRSHATFSLDISAEVLVWLCHAPTCFLSTQTHWPPASSCDTDAKFSYFTDKCTGVAEVLYMGSEVHLLCHFFVHSHLVHRKEALCVFQCFSWPFYSNGTLLPHLVNRIRQK